jgi:hypothetical protein
MIYLISFSVYISTRYHISWAAGYKKSILILTSISSCNPVVSTHKKTHGISSIDIIKH